jgi:hypothetical protein
MDGCLSTVESTAIALSHLEGKPDLKEVSQVLVNRVEPHF